MKTYELVNEWKLNLENGKTKGCRPCNQPKRVPEWLNARAASMRSRCRNKKNEMYHNYGGRGIEFKFDSVISCALWIQENLGASDEHKAMELDRIDNNGPYSKENCRWATRKEQNSNRRNCIYVECDGETVTLRELCRRRGLKYRPIVKRIKTRGWPIDRAISEPLHTNMKEAA